MKIFQNFNDIIIIISFIFNIIFVVIPLIIKIFRYLFVKRYIKLVLGYTEEDVKITNCIFSLSTPSNVQNDFVAYSSVLALNNINILFNMVNQRFCLDERIIDANNEMNIGGFTANKKVNAYFTKYFPNFKYVTNITNKEALERHPIDNKIFIYSTDNKKGFQINGHIFLNIIDRNTDYAILIKLTKEDFKDDNNRSVHIIFGGTDIGTIKGTEFLLTHYKQIYDTYGKNHYFFAIEINCIDESINYSKKIIDLTDEMF